MPEFNLLAAAVNARSLAGSAQGLVNLFPEIRPDGEIWLYGTPGKRLWATIGNGPIRGGLATATTLYLVSGNTVYSVTSGAVATSLGTITTNAGRVSLATNGVDVLLVDGTAGYRIASGVMTAIADIDFPNGVRYADYIDGFYIVGGNNTQKFYKSESLDGSSWDALDFASAESNPDVLVRPIVSNREILNFGRDSTEPWINTGAAGFPFERTGNATIENGAAAGDSICRLDSSVFWLGRNEHGQGSVWRLNGYSPVRISTHDEEHEIAQWADLSDAYAWAYTYEGHAFYVLSSASGDVSLVYDVASQRWHRRAWRDSNNTLHRDRIYTYFFFAGLHLGGDWETGRVYVLDMDTLTDNGDAIVREITAPHMRTGEEVTYHLVELRVEAGVGLTSGQGINPQVMLSTSRDGGRTFPVERWESLGAKGNYDKRVIWYRCGTGVSKAFRFRITDPVKIVILGARVEFS